MNSQKLVQDIQNYCDSVNAYKKKIKEIQKTDKMSKKAFFFDMGGASLSYCLIAILCLMPIALLKGDILLALIMGCGAGLVSGFFGGLTELIASKGKGKIGRVALTNNAKSYPWKSMTYSNILRKGYVTYKDIYPIINFFYTDLYNQLLETVELPFNFERFTKEQIINVLTNFKNNMGLEYDEEGWFENLKKTTTVCGFCPNVKEYKKNKEAYPGHVGDVSEMIRIAISTRKNTPNPYYVLKILGEKEVARRIDEVIKKIS